MVLLVLSLPLVPLLLWHRLPLSIPWRRHFLLILLIPLDPLLPEANFLWLLLGR